MAIPTFGVSDELERLLTETCTSSLMQHVITERSFASPECRPWLANTQGAADRKLLSDIGAIAIFLCSPPPARIVFGSRWLGLPEKERALCVSHELSHCKLHSQALLDIFRSTRLHFPPSTSRLHVHLSLKLYGTLNEVWADCESGASDLLLATWMDHVVHAVKECRQWSDSVTAASMNSIVSATTVLLTTIQWRCWLLGIMRQASVFLPDIRRLCLDEAEKLTLLRNRSCALFLSSQGFRTLVEKLEASTEPEEYHTWCLLLLNSVVGVTYTSHTPTLVTT